MKKIVVVKLGRNVVTTDDSLLDVAHITHIANQVKKLQETGYAVLLVVSCAVTCGQSLSGINIESKQLEQLVAGIGQAHAIHHLYKIFEENSLVISQLLLTKSDLEDKAKRENMKKVIEEAASRDIVLLLNENDIVELNSFDGNDYLATGVAKLVNANKLILLSDIEGVYDRNMNIISTILAHEKTSIGTVKSGKKQGIGGIDAKLTAARDSADAGIDTVITHGRIKNILVDLLIQHKHIGTHILHHQSHNGC